MSEARQQKTGWCRACHHARKMYYESPFLWPPPHTPGSAITQKNKRRRPVHRKELLQKNASTGTCVNPTFAITPGNTNKKARVPHSSHENTKTPTRCRRQKQAFTKSIRHERIDGLTQLWQWRRKKKVNFYRPSRPQDSLYTTKTWNADVCPCLNKNKNPVVTQCNKKMPRTVTGFHIHCICHRAREQAKCPATLTLRTGKWITTNRCAVGANRKHLQTKIGSPFPGRRPSWLWSQGWKP